MFAPTPPLESLRTVLSLACTRLPGESWKVWDADHPDRMQVLLLDISRAYFNAHTDPEHPSYVALPDEHADAGKGLCGRLLRHMYGTQRAADGWQQEYASAFVAMGFRQGVACPCVFWHDVHKIICTVHGDDFTAAGPRKSLTWFHGEMSQRYELTVGGRLGPGARDDKEGRVLNRVIRWTADGVEHEADPRQGERILEDLQLDNGVNKVGTPGVKPLAEEVAHEKLLGEIEQTKYRVVAARTNYLCADRPDMQYAGKEVCRFMAKPSDVSMKALKRLGRFILGRRRLVFRFDFQHAAQLEAYSDTDWGGCLRTRKSTSGGCLMFGGHMVKSWSSTQQSVSLSSGEAEFYGVVRASGIALGHQSLLKDLGYQIPVRIRTDSSAAIGICQRQGLGRLRHIDTQALWIQQKVKYKVVELRKVRGEINPADLFTKHLVAKDRIDSLVKLFNCDYREGRPDAAPQLRRSETNHEEDEAELVDIEECAALATRSHE